MIPKIIHYVWLGGQNKPQAVKTAIDSWKKYAPEYTIIEWNEDNFDLNESDFLAAAIKRRQYAFASDYIRLAVLTKFGGVYLDADMIMIQPFSLLESSKFELTIARITKRQIFGMGFIMAKPNQEFLGAALDRYKRMNMEDLNQQVANTELLSKWFASYYIDININILKEQRISVIRILTMRMIYQPGIHSVMIHVGVASWKKRTLKNQISSFCRRHITARHRLLLFLPMYSVIRRLI